MAFIGVTALTIILWAWLYWDELKNNNLVVEISRRINLGFKSKQISK